MNKHTKENIRLWWRELGQECKYYDGLCLMFLMGVIALCGSTALLWLT